MLYRKEMYCYILIKMSTTFRIYLYKLMKCLSSFNVYYLALSRIFIWYVYHFEHESMFYSYQVPLYFRMILAISFSFFAWLTTQNIWISVFYAWYYHNSMLRKIDNGSSHFITFTFFSFILVVYKDIIWSFSTYRLKMKTTP